jgi:acyl-CoA synthetase (AMP-forming)/AMP-acid ligase II
MTVYDCDVQRHAPRFGTTDQMLPDLLRQRENARTTAYEFLDAQGSVTSLTYGELGQRARRLAGALADVREGTRSPAVELHPPDLGFVVALCLLAGVSRVVGGARTAR